MEINSNTDQIINGYTMGDGYLSSSGNLTVDHGAEQRKFVEWLFVHFKHLCTPNRQISTVTRTRKGKVHKSFRFNTRSILKEYRTKWYLDNKKILPIDIEQMFTPLFISVWFACNGTKVIGSRGAKFDVTAYSPEEREVLKQLFKKKYNIASFVNRQGESVTKKTQWALVINADAYDAFRDLVTRETDLIQSLFPYKLHPKTK